MKQTLSTVLALAIAAAVLILAPLSTHGAPAAHPHSECNAAILTGRYGFSFTGFQNMNNQSLPFYGAGVASFDGAGNMSATFADSTNGVGATGQSYTATYTVNSDCSVLLVATPGSDEDNFAGSIVADGAEILTTDISAHDTLNLDFKRQ